MVVGSEHVGVAVGVGDGGELGEGEGVEAGGEGGVGDGAGDGLGGLADENAAASKAWLVAAVEEGGDVAVGWVGLWERAV